jgi:hypothetical protein
MITTLTALIKDQVLMMFLLHADLFVLLRIGKNKGILLFQGQPSPCLPAHSFLTRLARTIPRRRLSQTPAPLFTKGMPTAYAHFTGEARHFTEKESWN